MMLSETNTRAPWPTEFILSKDKRLLTVVFDEGSVFAFPVEYLRVCSPSAEVKGHTPAGRKTVYGKVNVSIRAIEPVGNYAIRLMFDDGHDTGYYDWPYLYELGRDHEARWQAYLIELEEKRLSREPLFSL